MYYRMKVAGLERDLPICPVNDKLYIAGFVIFGDQELTVACARELLARAPEYDYIITAEAKGIPLAHEMARQAGDAKYILARKGPKLYMRDIFSVTVNSITTAKEQKLYLDGADAALMKGKKILVVDDVISTGEADPYRADTRPKPESRRAAGSRDWACGTIRAAPAPHNSAPERPSHSRTR